jgi:hypothetical protein
MGKPLRAQLVCKRFHGSKISNKRLFKSIFLKSTKEWKAQWTLPHVAPSCGDRQPL